MSDYWLIGLALMLVIEGIMPFLFPAQWRDTFRRLVQLTDGQLRFIGLTSMLVGLLLLYWVMLVFIIRTIRSPVLGNLISQVFQTFQFLIWRFTHQLENFLLHPMVAEFGKPIFIIREHCLRLHNLQPALISHASDLL